MKALKKIIILAVLGIVACAGSQKEGLVHPGPVLVVENGTDEPLDCFADGWYLGTIKIAAKESFGNMRARKQKITAKGLTTGAEYWTIVDLSGKSGQMWKVEKLEKSEKKASPYTIMVKNQQGTKVNVSIDGHKRDDVAGLGSANFDVDAPGAHKVVIRDPASDINRYFTIYTQKGVSPIIGLNASKSVIRVKNRENKGVFVALDKGAARLVSAGKTLAFRRVSPGKHRVRFVAVSGQACGDIEVTAVEGGEIMAVPECPKAELMIINETPNEVEIQLGGGTLATCPAKGAVDIGNIPTGTLHLKAMAGDDLIAKAVRTARPGQKVLWMVTKGAGVNGNERLGTLVVYNQSGRDLQIWIDRLDRGVVRNGRNLLFTSMSPGDHSVTAYDTAVGTSWAAIMHYDGNERLKWTVGAALGSVRLKNLWKEPVTVLMDGGRTIKLKVNETREMSMPAGKHIIEVTGNTLELADKVIFDIDPGHRTGLNLLKPVGALIVHNAAARALEVFVDDKKIGLLGPGNDVKVDSIRSGSHKVVARDADTKARWLKTVNIPKGGTNTVIIGK